MKKIVTLFLILLLLSGCGPGCSSAEPEPPTPAVQLSEADEQPDLFRTVYRQNGDFGEPSWTILEFIPNGSLYLVRSNNGGICPLVDFGGYNSTSPYTIRDFNEYLKSGN